MVPVEMFRPEDVEMMGGLVWDEMGLAAKNGIRADKMIWIPFKSVHAQDPMVPL